MPIEIENRLKDQARKKGLTGEHFDAYVYGTLRRIEQRRQGGLAKTAGGAAEFMWAFRREPVIRGVRRALRVRYIENGEDKSRQQEGLEDQKAVSPKVPATVAMARRLMKNPELLHF